jgi:ElaB/YqjD/DUF883 family membrane-anchored ribosome-binding protein
MADTNGKHEDPTVQIAHLRAQVEALMRERVTPAVTDMAGCAENFVNSAASMVRDHAQSVSGQVREQPLVSVLVAAGVGYVLGRLVR